VGGIVELPILVLLARVDRTRVTTAHRDHGGPDDLVGERLRELLRHVDPDLAHGLDDRRVDLLRRIGARRPDMDPTAGAQLDEPRRHLAAARVVHADEEDLGLFLRALALLLPRRLMTVNAAILPIASTAVNILGNVKPLTTIAAGCSPLLENEIGETDAQRLAALLKVLAEPARLRLLSLIQSQPDGEACVCHLTAPLGLSQPTVSHHLKVLLEAGLVEREQRGNWAYFRVRP